MKVFQASKLVDKFELKKISSFSSDKLYFFSKSESKDNSSTNRNHILAPMNKVIESIKKFYEAYIKSKHIRIIKSKKMISTTKRLQLIHADLCGIYKPSSISGKNYMVLLLDVFTRKLWILMLRSKDEFFGTFKF